MQNMQVEFSFKGKARLHQIWNIITKGMIFTFLTEGDIIKIWKQYSDQKQLEAKWKEPTNPSSSK